MVALQILVLSVQVRILVEQQVLEQMDIVTALNTTNFEVSNAIGESIYFSQDTRNGHNIALVSKLDYGRR